MDFEFWLLLVLLAIMIPSIAFGLSVIAEGESRRPPSIPKHPPGYNNMKRKNKK